MIEQTTPCAWVYIGSYFHLDPNIGFMFNAKWRLGYLNNGIFIYNPSLDYLLHPLPSRVK